MSASRWRVLELATAVGSLILAARSAEGVSMRYVTIGLVMGIIFRLLEQGYVGRFRTNPVRNLLFQAGWLLVSTRFVRPPSEAASLSLGSGICLGAAFVSWK